jgi:hypothetical protein
MPRQSCSGQVGQDSRGKIRAGYGTKPLRSYLERRLFDGKTAGVRLSRSRVVDAYKSGFDPTVNVRLRHSFNGGDKRRGGLDVVTDGRSYEHPMASLTTSIRSPNSPSRDEWQASISSAGAGNLKSSILQLTQSAIAQEQEVPALAIICCDETAGLQAAADLPPAPLRPARRAVINRSGTER